MVFLCSCFRAATFKFQVFDIALPPTLSCRHIYATALTPQHWRCHSYAPAFTELNSCCHSRHNLHAAIMQQRSRSSTYTAVYAQQHFSQLSPQHSIGAAGLTPTQGKNSPPRGGGLGGGGAGATLATEEQRRCSSCAAETQAAERARRRHPFYTAGGGGSESGIGGGGGGGVDGKARQEVRMACV